MRLSDTVSGLLAAVFGIVIVTTAATFPPMPGQPVGPGLFPIAIGCGLVVFGAALALAGRRSGGAPSIQFEDWVRRPRMVGNLVLVIAVVLFYSIGVERVGFFLTALVFLSVLFAAFGVSRVWILPLAVIVTGVIHYGFYTLLRVPLPWGVLEAIAW